MRVPRWISPSLSLRLFLVLALFAAAPTVLMVTLSDFALRTTIGDEIGKAALGKLRVAHGIETILSDLVRNTCMRIALDPELQALGHTETYADLVADGQTQYQFARYLDLLDDTARTNPLFHSLSIVFADTDYVLNSDSGTVSRANFDDRVWLDEQVARLGFGGVGIFLPPHKVVAASEGDLVLSYYFPFPVYLTELQGAVVVHLREREFSRLINDTGPGEGGSVSLIDGQGVLLSHRDQGRVGTPWGLEKPATAVLDVTRAEGTLTLEGDGGSLVTWYRPEAGLGTYVGEFPLEELTRNVATVRAATVGASLALLLVGVVVSYLIARRFFHPVRRLIREVNRRLDRQEDWEGNELTLLSGAFDILLKRETQLFQDLEAQSRRRDEDWVSRILRGEARDQGPPNEALFGRSWLAGWIAFDHYQAFVRSYPPEQRDYLRSVVLTMAERAFLPEIRCLGTVSDPRGLALVLATDLEDGGAFADRIDDGFETLASEASRILGTSLTLCLGTRRNHRDDLPESWSEAEALVRQRFLVGPGRWFWEENPAVCRSEPFFPLRIERALVAAVESRDREALSSAFAELRQTFKARGDLSFDNVQLILHQLLGAAIRYLVENRFALAELFGSGDLHRALAEAETLGEALDWLEGVYRDAVNRPQDVGPGYVPAMLAFIRSHLHRPIGVEDVADAVGLSYSHARKVFEDAMGESIVDHTNALRVEEAKALLTRSSAPLENVAASVGYNSLQSFHRQFKKGTGLTPGEFRARAQGSEFAESSLL